MTSETTTTESVPRRGHILIDENLTEMEKLMIYLAFTGVLFLRSVSFYYQEAEYANPEHPQHKHYNDAAINKRVNLAAAILVFMWYLYSTFLIEPFYHKYVTRRSELLKKTDNSSQGQQDGQQPKEEKTASETADGPYDEVTQKTKSINALEMIHPRIRFKATIESYQEVLFTSAHPGLPLPKKMTLAEYAEWRNGEVACLEVPEVESSE